MKYGRAYGRIVPVEPIAISTESQNRSPRMAATAITAIEYTSPLTAMVVAFPGCLAPSWREM